MRDEPVPIPEMEIRRLTWKPWRRERWLVTILVKGEDEAMGAAYTRRRAFDLGRELMWSV